MNPYKFGDWVYNGLRGVGIVTATDHDMIRVTWKEDGGQTWFHGFDILRTLTPYTPEPDL